MKTQPIFRGTATALVTPFRDGEIDRPALLRLLDLQISAGVDAIVIGGTTGEAATLSDDERYALFSLAAERVAGKCKLIFGVGTNDTRVAVRHAKRAAAVGCDGLLAVTPYYNKGTDSGILRHFLSIADATDLPLLLYNVPTRTGVNLPLPVLEVLAGHEKIAGIKEACDSTERLAAVAALGDALPLYAGNDAATVPVLSLGGKGVVSVASGLYPKEITAITDLWFAGKHDESRDALLRALPLMRSLFLETNPAPIKYLLARKGLCTDEMRLPLTPPSGATREKLLAAARAYENENFS